jgi:hypothetical protein
MSSPKYKDECPCGCENCDCDCNQCDCNKATQQQQKEEVVNPDFMAHYSKKDEPVWN